jgi:hypothetical protein
MLRHDEAAAFVRIRDAKIRRTRDLHAPVHRLEKERQKAVLSHILNAGDKKWHY